jgi:hypothetical protein
MFKRSVRSLQKTLCRYYEYEPLMMFSGVVALCSESHKKCISVPCGQNAEV